MWITSSLNTAKTPTAIALGNFDGVHRGHRQVIEPILPVAAQPPVAVPCLADHDLQCLSAWDGLSHNHNAMQGGWSEVKPSSSTVAIGPSEPQDGPTLATVVTFFPHPQEFFSGRPRLLLTPLQEKALHLKSMGVEQLVLLPFTQALANLAPEAFVEEILIRRLQARHISVGVDFRFGRHRAGTVEDLQAIASRYGVQVNIVPLKTSEGERISSSAIRDALQTGNLRLANHLLGRSYTLTGWVTRGQQLGRTIGFPTANLKLPPEKFLPRDGVYSVYAYLKSAETVTTVVPGVVNIGRRPTVDGLTRTIEVHLFDWSGDLYDQTLSISLEDFLRPEQKFGSLDELRHQIQQDCQTAKAMLGVGQPPLKTQC